MESRILIDLSKIETIGVANDTTVTVQFVSGLTKRVSFKDAEDAESLSRAFYECLIGEKTNSFYVIWQSDLAEVYA